MNLTLNRPDVQLMNEASRVSCPHKANQIENSKESISTPTRRRRFKIMAQFACVSSKPNVP